MALRTTLSKDATEESEEDKKKKKAKSKATTGTATGVGSGAASGAAAGTMISPGVGTVIGAGIGAAAGAVDANRADKATDPNRPKRRRLAAAGEKVREQRGKQERALATLSQAVFDWAASIR